jgi:hypothetical protein
MMAPIMSNHCVSSPAQVIFMRVGPLAVTSLVLMAPAPAVIWGIPINGIATNTENNRGEE